MTIQQIQTFPVKLLPWQSHVQRVKSRFKVLVCGRRSGKSILGAIEAKIHSRLPNQVIWCVAETHGQAIDLYWNNLVVNLKCGTNKSTNQPIILPPLIDRKLIKRLDKSAGRREIHLYNGTVIRVVGSNNIDSLLGVSIDLLILDEFQAQKEGVFEYLRPTLSDRKGKCLILGTPRGYGNQLWDYYWMGAPDNPNRSENWFSYAITTLNAGAIDAEEIAQARNDMDEMEFKQEYEASFQSYTGLVYRSFDSKLHVFDDLDSNVYTTVNGVIMPKNKPILCGMDFNVGHMTPKFACKVNGVLEVFDEISMRNTNTQAVCEAIRSKYGSREIIVGPDPSGGSRDTTGGFVGETDHSILERYKFTLLIPNTNDIPPRVNTVNWMLKDANGKVRLKFYRKGTPLAIQSMSASIYGKDSKPFKDGKLDASADAIQYLCLSQSDDIQTFSHNSFVRNK